MRSFLRYISGQKAGSSLTARIEKAVMDAKERKEWSREYMTLYEIRKMDREEGRKEGREKERAELIKAMTARGMTAEGIANVTGLDLQDIKNIKSETSGE